MAELVAHEIEIAFASKGEGDEADHLVQSDSPVDDNAGIGSAHVPIQILIHQPESEGFIADKSLVVGFRVADMLLLAAAVQQDIVELAQIPILVALLLE